MGEKFNICILYDDIQNIGSHLEKLTKVSGPSRCIAKLHDNFDPRIADNEEFFFFKAIKSIVNELNESLTRKIQIKQHNGNIVIIGGFTKTPKDKKIKQLPITLASHGDEITFLVTRRKHEKIPLRREVIPICSVDIINKFNGFYHNKVKIFGFRIRSGTQKFIKLGDAVITQEKSNYYIDISRSGKIDLREGDVVIQNYGKTSSRKYTMNTIFQSKALDDRIGVLSHLYTIYYLSKYTNLKSKAIIVGDEEGVPKDVSWARLTQPTFKKYCRQDGVILICDGLDGAKLTEFPRFKHVKDALIIPYTSEGKGGGDHGLFSYFRDSLLRKINDEKVDFHCSTCTNYASRSLDPKLMDRYPLIGFISWSNGPVTGEDDPKKVDFERVNRKSVSLKYIPFCHLDESVSIRQILNIIGTTFYAVKELYSKYN